MSFEFKFRIYIFSLIFFFLTIFVLILYMIADLYITNKQISKLTNENITLLNETQNSIKKTIENVEEIDTYLSDPTLPEKFAEAYKLGKYIDIDNKDELQKIADIIKTTPLDINTASIIIGYSKRLDIPPSLLLALIEQESNFNQYEIGKHQDRGYCQIIPNTERWLADNYGHILGLEYNPKKIFEPEYNIGLGALYLHILKQAYGDDYHKILSEYNRGIFNLQKYYEKHGTYVTAYSRSVLKREAKYRSIN